MPLNTILESTTKKMNDSVEHTRRELAAVRTGGPRCQSSKG